MLTHVVMLELRDPAEADRFAARLRGLEGRVPGLLAVRAGANAIPSDRAKDLVLIADFEDEAALAAYQDHPAHLEIAGDLRAAATSIAVVDFTS